MSTAVNDVASIVGIQLQKNEKRRDDMDEDRGRVYKCAELVSRRCTLIRLLCTVIGCDIRPFTRLAEQMEANRMRFLYGVLSRVGVSISDSTTSFSLTNKRPFGGCGNLACFI